MLNRSTVAGTSSKHLKIRNERLKLEIKINSRGMKSDPEPNSEQTAQSKSFLVDICEMVR